MSTRAAMPGEFVDIVDFTAASDWERLVAQIERHLRSWDLYGFSEFSIGSSRTATFSVGGAEYELSVMFPRRASLPLARSGQERYPRAMVVWMDADRDFPHECHVLQRWFGVTEFAVLERRGVAAGLVDAMSLLGALTVAMGYAHCALAHFVPVAERGDAWGQRYVGYYADTPTFARFEVASVLNPAPDATRLGAVLALMAAKLHMGGRLSALAEEAANADADARARAGPLQAVGALRAGPAESVHAAAVAAEADVDTLAGFAASGAATLSVRYLYECRPDRYRWRAARGAREADAEALRWGPAVNPVDALGLATTWPPMASEVSSKAFGDPRAAPMWTLRLSVGPLSPSLTVRAAVNELLLAREDAIALSVADLRALVRPRKLGALPQTLFGHRTVSSRDAPNETLIGTLLTLVFASRGARSPAPSAGVAGVVDASDAAATAEPEPLWRRVGGARTDSTTARFVDVALGYGLRGIGRLWAAFVATLRQRWYALDALDPETPASHQSLSLAGLAPDLGASLIQQKVEMLNCCIHAKRARAELVASDGAAFTRQFGAGDTRVGVLRVLDGAELADGRPLCVPLCQPSTPQTTDLIAERIAILESLGTGSAASADRQLLQVDSLVADMEAFKAANPGAVLIDFVRWHSPRDVVAGALSERMAVEGNLWLRTWAAAQPRACWLQPPSFDADREAERLLVDLAELAPAALMDELLHVALGVALDRLREGVAASGSRVAARAADALERSLCAGHTDAVALVAEFGRTEHTIAVALSLARKLPSCVELVDQLVVNLAALVPHAARECVAAAFTDERSGEPAIADSREYVLRVHAPPATASWHGALDEPSDEAGVGSRVYVCVADGEMRVATVRAGAD